MVRFCVGTYLFIALAGATPEYIAGYGKPNVDLIQSMYDILGGTFNLSRHNIEGFEGAIMSGLLFDYEPNYSLFYNGTMRSSSSGLSERAPITYSIPSCLDADDGPSDDGSWLLSNAQQSFILNIFCKHVAAVQGGVWGSIGAVIGNVACGPGWKRTCNVVIAFTTGVAGAKIGPLMQKNCKLTYEMIEFGCMEKGGSVQGASSDGQTFQGEIYAIEAAPPTTDPCEHNTAWGDCMAFGCTSGCKMGTAPFVID